MRMKEGIFSVLKMWTLKGIAEKLYKQKKNMPESFKNKSVMVAMGNSGLAGWSWFHSCFCYFTRWKVPESKWCDRHYECHGDTAEALECLWPPLISAATAGDISL